MQGTELTIGVTAPDALTVSSGDVIANVVCANIPTANATVFLIDKVLMPPASQATSETISEGWLVAEPSLRSVIAAHSSRMTIKITPTADPSPLYPGQAGISPDSAAHPRSREPHTNSIAVELLV